MWHSLGADVRFYLDLRYRDQRRFLALIKLIFSPRGLLIVTTQRLGHSALRRRAQRGWTLKCLVMRYLACLGRPIVVLYGKSDVLEAVELADGIYLSDLGNLVIGAKRIGSGTIIHHRVTLGMGLIDTGHPTIGENVWIGPDCVLHGNIIVGDGATILPGTVLSKSIPPRAVVRGNPARIVRLDYDNAELRRSTAYDSDVVKRLLATAIS